MEPKQRSIHILKTASRLMAHYGFDKTTMEDIAREAGVWRGEPRGHPGSLTKEPSPSHRRERMRSFLWLLLPLSPAPSIETFSSWTRRAPVPVRPGKLRFKGIDSMSPAGTQPA